MQMSRWSGIVLAALLVLAGSEAIELTEVFYDAEGSDNNKEFVEFLTNKNLTGWVIADSEANDTLTPVRINVTHPYTLIVEDGFNSSGLACSIYSAGSTIGNNLNNDGDQIVLWNGSLVLNISYNDTAETGNSLERNGSWVEGVPGGTPCSPPLIREPTPAISGIDLTLAIPDEIFSEEPVEDPFILEQDGHQSGDPARNVSVEIMCGETEMITVPVKRRTSQGTGLLILEPGEYDCCFRVAAVDGDAVEDEAVCQKITVVALADSECDVELDLELDQSLIESGARLHFDHHLRLEYDVPYVIRYTIEDIDGNVLRNATTTNTKRKQFTPGTTAPLTGLRFRSHVEEIACKGVGRMADEEVLLVRGPQPALPEQDSILAVMVEEARGERELPITLSVYRGNTSKHVVKIWAEMDNRSVSETSSLTLNRYAEAEVSFSLPLTSQATGVGTVIVEGLDKRVSAPFTVAREERVPPRISSLFSQAKLLADRITLYAWLDGKGEFIYELVTSNGSVRGNVTLDGSTRISVNATVRNESNIYLLRILEGNETLVERSLLLEARNGRLVRVDRFSPRAPQSEGKTAVEDSEQNLSTEPPLVTGSAIMYSRESPLDRLKYVLGLIGATLGGIIIKRQ